LKKKQKFIKKTKKLVEKQGREGGNMDGQTLQILGVKVDSTSLAKVLGFLSDKIAQKKGFSIVTPNPVFIVAAQKDKNFRKILNQADLSIPDGVGLILASRFLGARPLLKTRITGADLVKEILEIAQKKKWRIGIIGARRGEIREVKELLNRLKQKYPRLRVGALELTKNWPEKTYQLIFVAYGMGKQEKWIWKNRKKARGVGFVAIGRSLDFLTGFSRRAPGWMRSLGLEWLWRLIQEPSHIERVFVSCVVFPWLVLKEKIKTL
jgi:N-acetylglucosaminyldiphosphoundecaprenol N-acetyl-beta-D-mannosaminyltransferase